MVAEPGLDESTDPAELIVADDAAIDTTIGHLRRIGEVLARTARGLRGIELGQWTGEAADAFRARFDESPAAWSTGADAFTGAATACDRFRRAVMRARAEAARAVELHRAGIEAGVAAAAAHDAAVSAFLAQSAAAVAGQAPPPDPPPAFADPGVPMLEQAARILADARRDRDDAGDDAALAVARAAASAPDPPPVADRVGAELDAGLAESGRVLAGVGEGVAGISRVARTVNPADPWNVTHPASYVEGLSATVAGAASAGLHPAELVKGATGTGWGSDPATALGRLLPGIALSAATGGAGKAAGVAERGAASAVPHRPGESPALIAADVGGGTPGDTGPERPPPKTEESPDLPARAELNWPFRGEERGMSWQFPGRFVHYLDDVDREESRLTVHDGLLYDAHGELFNSAPNGSHWSPGEPRSIFVMDPAGNLYASNDQVVGRMHHSSFLAGQPVAGAGEIGVVDGRVQAISDRSGHYTPPPECLDQVAAYLRGEGVNLDGIQLERFGG